MVEQKDLITALAGVGGTVTSLSLALVGILATANVSPARKREVSKLVYGAGVTLLLAGITTVACLQWLYRMAPNGIGFLGGATSISTDVLYQVAWVCFLLTGLAILYMSFVTIFILGPPR